MFMLVCLSVSILVATAHARIVVNEVMANTATSSLQWVELYNDSGWGASLDGCRLETPSGSISFPDDLIINAYSYFIICRQLYAGSSNSGFETVWGNASGQWGDVVSEWSLGWPYAATIDLPTAAGYVYLYDSTNVRISEMVWNSPQPLGVSLERARPDSSRTGPCEDARGGTPFRLNSITPFGHDIAISNGSVFYGVGGYVAIQFMIHNSGVDTVADIPVSVLYAGTDDTILTYHVTNFPPGVTRSSGYQVKLPGMYIDVDVRIPDDDRPENNSLTVTVPGELFPPFKLSEFAPVTGNDIKAEWIELRKRIDTPWDIAGWFLTVNGFEVPIAPYTEIISSDYVILTEDQTKFYESYPDVTAPVIELPAWHAINNSGTAIRLIDQHNLVADYTNFPGGNSEIVWSEYDEDGKPYWGPSYPILGTPGAPNQVLTAEDTTLSLTIDPRTIDGRYAGAEVHFQFTAPPDANVTLKLFDRSGREVVTLLDNTPISTHDLYWNCRDNNREQLPIGIYIAYLEVNGKGVKETFVIAR